MRSAQSSDPELQRLLNQVLTRLRRQRPKSSRTIQVSEQDIGTTFEVVSKGKKPGESNTEQFRVKSIEPDYLVCRTWNGTTEGGTDIKVAKPFLLRKTAFSTSGNFSLIFNGKLISFAYLSTTTRRATVSGKSWTQAIVPAYQVNDVIYGAQLTDTPILTAEDDVEYVDLNTDGRQWATPMALCDTGVAKTFYALGFYPPYA